MKNSCKELRSHTSFYLLIVVDAANPFSGMVPKRLHSTLDVEYRKSYEHIFQWICNRGSSLDYAQSDYSYATACR